MNAPGYPEIVRNAPDQFLVCPSVDQTWVSVDFEFNPAYPTIPTETGLSAGCGAHTMIHNGYVRQLLNKLDMNGYVWVGHNALTTERAILEAELKRPIPLERMEDTMVLHYLANAHLCKGAAKDEDEADPRGAGFMDLWSMASLYTDLPQWKRCRGARCSGPCPTHDHLGYNGVDAYAVDIAYPALKADLAAKGVPESLVTHVKKMVVLCDLMTQKGIKVDRALVRSLEREMFERKDKLFPSRMERPRGKPTKKEPEGKLLKNEMQIWDAPFNPRSPQAVLAWFKAAGIDMESCEKEEIQKHVERVSETHPAYEWLDKLYEFKSEGKGLGPWFDDRYFHSDGLMHPRFNPLGSSMGRLASSNPNFQNIPARGFGRNVRRVVVPRDSSLVLAKADKSQLELRMVLYHAGVFDSLPYDEDAFTWLVKAGNGVFEKAAEITKLVSKDPARDMAKSVSHGADYGEGIKILYGKDLDSTYNKNLINKGALVVYRDWEVFGGVVAFTGTNLAERFFGSRSEENRRKALEIQEAYFSRFPEIRRWQQRVSREAERGYCQSPSGRYLQLNGSPEDKIKMAYAFYGQGGGADDVQEGMLRYYEQGLIPLIQVHDENVFEFPRDVTNKQLLDHFSIMSMESKFYSGFRCPVQVSRGDNWLDMEKVGRV